MGTPAGFDLEKAIATWRRFLTSVKGLSGEDIDELEAHLRDEIEVLIAEGESPEAAYAEAQRRLGTYATIEAAYEPMSWRKARQERRLMNRLTIRATMLTNYFKITLRNLRRQAGYTLINVGGFAVGLVCVFLIVIYVDHERSFDRFHEKADRIYLLTYTSRQDGAEHVNTFFPASKGPRLEEAFPEVAHAVRVWNSGIIARVKGEPTSINPFYPVDDAFFRTFSFPLLRGDPETVLNAPNAAVLVESQARTLFGDDDPIGKTLPVVSFTEPLDLVVTGVMADPPPNSLFSRITGVYNFDALAANFGREAILDGQAGPSNFNIYVELHPGSDPDVFAARTADFVRREFQPSAESNARLELYPLAELHLGDEARRTLRVFTGVALLILLIACVNFMNLATARAAQRAREVGVRKTMGAHRRQLVWQFLGESVFLSLLSMTLALVLTPLLLPSFAELIGQPVDISLRQNLHVVMLLAGIGLLAGIVAGSYPAFYLSAFRPARVLKGKTDRGQGAARLRKGLIVFQFAISVFLIVGTLTMQNQLRYMKSRPLGFEKEQVVFAGTSPSIRDRLDVFKAQLAQHPGVLAVTATNGVPGRVGSTRDYSLPTNVAASHVFHTVYTDPQYLDVLGLSLQAGRFLSDDIASDRTGAALVNETAVRRLGLEDPIGQTILEGDRTLEVIGVLQDFHFQSLTQAIQPLVVQMDPTQAWYISARLAPQNLDGALAHLEEQWKAFDPNRPFNASFLDAVFDGLYSRQERQGKLYDVFALIAVFIACLGLFGLAAFIAGRRTKEIGIRKVLGATVPGVVLILSRDFAKLVLIACLLAVPASYYAMNRWLEDFAYRTDVSWTVFALAAGLTLSIAMLTIGYQAVRAAVADPVKSLRYE